MTELTRSEAIAIVGTELVEKVEAENCEYYGLDTSMTEYYGSTLYSAEAKNDTHQVAAYYVVDTDELDAAEELDEIRWEIRHFEVEEI